MSYISKLKIDSGDALPIGSSLYGVCTTGTSTAAKEVSSGSLLNFDSPVTGTTIHVKFTQGNSATSGLTLKIGSMTTNIAVPSGAYNWPQGGVISFTLDGNTAPYTWIANDSDSGQQVTILQQYDSTSADAISGVGVADALSDYDATLGNVKTKNVVTSSTGIIESGASSNNSDNTVPTTAAVTAYVTSKTAGLTGAMHFIGITTTAVTDGGTEVPTISNSSISATTDLAAGDVVLYRNGSNVIGQEYVWTGSAWELLGDEGSYALKSSTSTVIKTASFTQNTLPTLTVTPVSISPVRTAGTAPTLTTNDVSIPVIESLGSAADFTISNGVLQITKGSTPSFGPDISVTEVSTWSAGTDTELDTAISIGSASGWYAGTQASLSTTTETVVVP